MSELPPELENPTVIRENQRFATYQATYDGCPVFVKQVLHPDLETRIRQEAWGLEAFAELDEASKLPFELPGIVTMGRDFIVTTWVDGSPMVFEPGSPDYEANVHFFAESLVAIDQRSQFASPMRPKFDTTAVSGRNDIERLQARIGKVDYRQFFSLEFVDRCFAYLQANIPKLEARLTHPDFTPSNVLVSDGKKTLIDFESVSLRWPRFYDLVNLTYNRMIMEPRLDAGCRQIARIYFGQNTGTSVEACLSQLNAIAIVRSLSMISELMSEPDAYHNTQQTMTVETADRLRTCSEAIMAGTVYFEAPVAA